MFSDGVEYTTTPLHKHQVEAVDIGTRALAMHGGVLIADEMGLGKTLMAMQLFLAKMFHNCTKKKSTKILIVAPSSVLIEWCCQLKKHINRNVFPQETCAVVSYNIKGKTALNSEQRKKRLQEWMTENNKSHIVLASYGTVRNDAAFLLRKKWNYVVMDECHQLKNPQSNTHKLFMKYMRSKSKRIGISGTPNANHPVKDLCALSEVLFPSLPELSDEQNYKKCRPSVLQHLIIRRTLDDVGLTLPSLHIRQVSLSYANNTPEWNAYNDQLDKTMKALNNYIKSKRYKSINSLIALGVYQCELNMLGIVCTHYQISDVRHKILAAEETEMTTKEKYVQKVIDEYAIGQQQKLIVTSASSTFLKIVHAKNDAKHECATVLFTGETPLVKRESVLNHWRSMNGPNVLLLSMKAGGVGLTLVEANRMVCVDGLSQSNPAVRDQVIKRIHRMGQTNDVYIDDLCVKGTIDEVMKEIVHPSKRRVANLLLRRLPALEGNATRKTNVNELCSIGKVLYPMWQKMNSDTVSTSHTLTKASFQMKMNTVYSSKTMNNVSTNNPANAMTVADESRGTKRIASIGLSTRRIKKRIRKLP